MSDASNGRVLISGGAGFLGINLTRYLLDRGYDVTSLDIASSRSESEISRSGNIVRIAPSASVVASGRASF